MSRDEAVVLALIGALLFVIAFVVLTWGDNLEEPRRSPHATTVSSSTTTTTTTIVYPPPTLPPGQCPLKAELVGLCTP